MLGYYFINVIMLLIDTLILCFIKFIKYNRSIVGESNVAGWTVLYGVVLFLTIAIVACEIVRLRRTKGISLTFVIVTGIMFVFQFVAYDIV